MRLILVRHGQANPADIDPEKGLSETGRLEVARLGSLIGPLQLGVDEIWHSDKVRARQTAELLAQAIKAINGLVQKRNLGPNDDVAKVTDAVMAENKDLMIVGHLPFMNNMLSYLLAGDQHRCVFAFPAAGMAQLEYDGNRWRLQWFINPEFGSSEAGARFRSYH